MKRVLQRIVSAIVRPYIHRELPGWGRVYAAVIGGSERDWFWRDPGERVIREKITGRTMRLDISRWPDRSVYFLGRWYSLETHLLIKLLIRPGDTVIDVGANRGMFAFAAAHQVGDNGHVFAFEPNLNCVRLIERELKENSIKNLSVFPFGIGDHNECRTLSVPMTNSGEATFGISPYDAITKISSELKIGDDVFKNITPNFLKIDVEGYECKAISGMTHTIERHHPAILMEAIASNLEICGNTLDQLYVIMDSLGYSPFNVTLHRKAMGRYYLHIDKLRDEPSGTDLLWLSSNSSLLSLVGTSARV